MKNFNSRNATTKTRFPGNLAINTTKWYNPREDLKNCENCKRKEIENNKIRKKVLNDINKVDHINFQTGNKISRCRSFFRFISLDSYWCLWIEDMFRGNQKKWGNIYFYGYGSVIVDLFRSCRFAYVPPNSCSYKFSRIDRKISASKSLFDKVADLMPATSLRNVLRHKYFTVGFAKFSRAAFLKEHPRWLPLYVYGE